MTDDFQCQCIANKYTHVSYLSLYASLKFKYLTKIVMFNVFKSPHTLITLNDKT